MKKTVGGEIKKEMDEAETAEELSNLKEAEVGKKKEKIIPPKPDEKVEPDKKLMMWAGVSFFMVLILAGWVLNIKSIFEKTERAKDTRQFEWGKITNEFNQAMEQIKKGVEELKRINIEDDISTTTNDVNGLLPESQNTEISPSDSLANDGGQLKAENGESLEELKNRLRELEEKIENKN